MAKVTRLKAGLGRKNKGTFHCERFNLFDDEGSASYADLMTRAQNAASGITIEHIREYSRKTTIREGDGAEQVVTTTEEIILVVQYWEKPKKKRPGGTDEELKTEEDALKCATAG